MPRARLDGEELRLAALLPADGEAGRLTEEESSLFGGGAMVVFFYYYIIVAA